MVILPIMLYIPFVYNAKTSPPIAIPTMPIPNAGAAVAAKLWDEDAVELDPLEPVAVPPAGEVFPGVSAVADAVDDVNAPWSWAAVSSTLAYAA